MLTQHPLDIAYRKETSWQAAYTTVCKIQFFSQGLCSEQMLWPVFQNGDTGGAWGAKAAQEEYFLGSDEHKKIPEAHKSAACFKQEGKQG